MDNLDNWQHIVETRNLKLEIIFLGFRVQGLGFRVQDLGFRVQDLEFRVQISDRIQISGIGLKNSKHLRVQGLEFRVQGLDLRQNLGIKNRVKKFQTPQRLDKKFYFSAFGIFNLQILGPDLRDQEITQKAVFKNFTSRPKIKVVEFTTKSSRPKIKIGKFTTKNQSRRIHDQKSKSQSSRPKKVTTIANQQTKKMNS